MHGAGAATEYTRDLQAIYWALEDGAASGCCKIKHN